MLLKALPAAGLCLKINQRQSFIDDYSRLQAVANTSSLNAASQYNDCANYKMPQHQYLPCCKPQWQAFRRCLVSIQTPFTCPKIWKLLCFTLLVPTRKSKQKTLNINDQNYSKHSNGSRLSNSSLLLNTARIFDIAQRFLSHSYIQPASK